eukprot:9052647-Prorocentrum_lima.AAC.1
MPRPLEQGVVDVHDWPSHAQEHQDPEPPLGRRQVLQCASGPPTCLCWPHKNLPFFWPPSHPAEPATAASAA